MSRYFIINPQHKITNVILSDGIPSSELLGEDTAKSTEELQSADIGDYYISDSDTLVKIPSILTNNFSSSLLTASVDIQFTFSRDVNSFDVNSTREGIEIDNITHTGDQVTFNITTGSIESKEDEEIEEYIHIEIKNVIDADNRNFNRIISFSQPMFIPSSSVE